MKGFQKAGRKPKGWKPPYSKSLQVKKEKIVIIFDDNNKGDLKDLMMKVKDSPQEDHQD